jgi:hypothetical protein
MRNRLPLYLLLLAAVVIPATTPFEPGVALAVQPPDNDTVTIETTPEDKHDHGPKLKEEPPKAQGEGHRVVPLKSIKPEDSGDQKPDPALQGAAGAQVASTPGTGFPGVGQGDYGYSDRYAPPDTNGAVGETQYVQWVNAEFAVFDKATGNKLYGPAAANTLWSGFGGGCERNNDGDPIVQYDKAAKRWVFTQFSISGKPYLQCVAVSTSSDALGSYNRYAFSYGNTDFPDYPKLGVWPDAYYISFNVFRNGVSFTGPRICAYDRAKMLAGQPASQQCGKLSSSYASLLPSDLDGSTAPPSGRPNFFLSRGTSTTLRLWKFHVDWSNPGSSTISGPTSISVQSNSTACGGGACIPQPGTSQKLDSLGDRLMYRLAYRNFGDHEALVVNHSVNTGSGNTGIRWYEIRNPNGTPSVFQQGTFAPDGQYRWMGSIAMDKAGNVALGYSLSGSSQFPSIAYTGRLKNDPLNQLSGENIVKSGAGSQLTNLDRWGDYSSMSIDPADDCTFWYTTEYLKANGTFNWSTWIQPFKLSGCS